MTPASREVLRLDDALAAVEQKLAELSAAREPFLADRQALQADIEGRHPTGDERRRLQDIDTAVNELEFGGVGVNLRGDMYKTPGLHQLRRQLESLQAERAKLVARESVNPDEPVLCRLTRMVSHVYEGRRLKVGEEVLLTRSQLEAFSDRFEPVGASDG
ncbi:MAG TPA: hypothetical protein VNJ02_00250 [Vicinamibacterales bacterium]|nr:hypothetical protein [Vicinamibacterales bacterium]